MATLSDRSIIVEMLENDGVYPGDPKMCRIYEYTGLNAEKLYAVFMRPEDDDMWITPYARNPVRLWSEEGGLTPAGVMFLQAYGTPKEDEEEGHEYLVRWEMEFYASSAEEAAQLALEVQRDPTSEATAFTVIRADEEEHIVL